MKITLDRQELETLVEKHVRTMFPQAAEGKDVSISIASYGDTTIYFVKPDPQPPVSLSEAA